MEDTVIKKFIIAAAFTMATGFAANAEDMVFTSWGGTTQDAQKEAWADPFTKASGINVLQDGPTDYGKLKAMVDSGNVSWMSSMGDMTSPSPPPRPGFWSRSTFASA